jgi:hypothetical protein
MIRKRLLSFGLINVFCFLSLEFILLLVAFNEGHDVVK